MKIINKYILFALTAVIAAVSCDKNDYPVFDDKNAFVAFDKQTYSVPESYSKDGKVVRIPVTLASVAGLQESVKYQIVYPEKKAAVEGVNFEMVSSSGVLSFDAQNRTQYIEFVTKADGKFTGDIKFDIELLASETVNAGSESVCTVTINDEDHPLGFLIGEYAATGEDNWDGVVTWTMTLSKDEDDISKVWIHNIANAAIHDNAKWYGNVNDDRTVINVPFGQECGVKYNDKPLVLWGLTGEGNGYDTGSVDIIIGTDDAGNVTLDFGEEWGFWITPNVANFAVVWPGIKAVHK